MANRIRCCTLLRVVIDELIYLVTVWEVHMINIYIYTHLYLHVAWIKYKKSNKNMDQNKEGDDPSQRV